MNIDIFNMAASAMEHFKDGPGTAQVRKVGLDIGAIAQVTLPVGAGIGYHKHEGNCEVIYVVSGVGVCCDDGEEYPVSAGTVTYCPEGHSHSMTNTGDEPLVLLGILPDVK